MIFFLNHDPSNAEMMSRFMSAAHAGGEQSQLYHEPPDKKAVPSTLALRHLEIDPHEISGFEKWRLSCIPEAERATSCDYGQTDDELDDAAVRWFAHYIRELDFYRQVHRIDHVVTWGSSHIGNRACLLAAEYFDLPISVLEFGFFRQPWQIGIDFCLGAERAYYERHPRNWWIGRDEFEHQPERLSKYRDWWKQSIQTKFSGSQKHNTHINDGMPPSPLWTQQEGPRILWAGQVHQDAAMYWGAPDEAKKQLRADALAADAWLKPHPFAFRHEEEEEGFRVIEPAVNIHRVLCDADRVMGMTTNVMLEAWMYGGETDIYGDPFFRGIAPPDRERFLDYVIHEVQFSFEKPWRFVRKLKESEAWQRAKKTETAEAVA